MMPQILKDIVKYLKKNPVNISGKIEGEGRVASLIDEGSIKKALFESPFKERILDEKARRFGDMIVVDYDDKTRYVVNIKTSSGSTDNCFSKVGFVYMFTNLSETSLLLKPMNFIEMDQLIKEYKADIHNKDYYYLCIDKKDSSRVMMRGAKQIKNWVVNINPGNILQVNWKKEKECDPVNRTWDEAYDLLIKNGVAKSLMDFWNNVPEEWKSSN